MKTAVEHVGHSQLSRAPGSGSSARLAAAPLAQKWPGSVKMQRKCACGSHAVQDGECDECRKRRLQRSAVRQWSGLVVPSEVDHVLRSPGRGLDAATGRLMQERLGHDFSHVRIHDDAQASESAAAVSARAYTVGNHVVFGAGEFRDGSPATQRLLAHELTHVVQQQGSSLSGEYPQRLEAEAERSEHAFARGEPMPSVAATGRSLSRDEDTEAVDDAATQADAAEAACDIRSLCRLHFRAPERVDSARVSRVFSACHPEISPVSLVGGSPCLTPNFGLLVPPSAGAGAGGPRTAGPAPRRAARGGSASSGGLSLPSTTIRFNLGPAAFTVDLPSSLAIRLPVPFQGAQRVVFSLTASPDEFTFTATINAVPHVRITARAGMTTEGVGSARLTVETTHTTCRAQEAESARSALQSAGERLRDAIQAVQTPPPVAEDASELERTFDPEIRLAEVVSAVVAVNSAIDRARAACREVPVFTGEFGVRGQLTRPESGEPAPTYLGGTATWHF